MPPTVSPEAAICDGFGKASSRLCGPLLTNHSPSASGTCWANPSTSPSRSSAPPTGTSIDWVIAPDGRATPAIVPVTLPKLTLVSLTSKLDVPSQSAVSVIEAAVPHATVPASVPLVGSPNQVAWSV